MVGDGGRRRLSPVRLRAASQPRPSPPCRRETWKRSRTPTSRGSGVLHSLLDHLVDRSYDATLGQRSLIDYYSSPEDAAARMQALAARAMRAAQALPQGRRHAIVLTGMAGFYLSAREASAREARPISRGVREAVGGLVAPTMAVFRARRVVGGLAGIRESQEASGEHLRSEPGEKNGGVVGDERDAAVAVRVEL